MKKCKSLITKLPESQTVLTSANNASAKSKKSSQLMLRSFIHDRLYGLPDASRGLPGGYFFKKEHQVGKLKAPIEFP